MTLLTRNIGRIIMILAALLMITSVTQNSSAADGGRSSEDCVRKEKIIEKILPSALTDSDLEEDRRGYLSSEGKNSIQIPKDPDDSIVMNTKNAGIIKMDLPDEVSGEKGKLIDGTVVYDAEDENVAVAVRCEDQKKGRGKLMRSLIVISSPDAPKEYTFDFGLEYGQHLEKDRNGCVYIVSGYGGKAQIKAEILPAWAKDAAGNSVSSHYRIKGNSLIQTVDIDDDTKYPVTADPAIGGYYYKKSKVKIYNEWGSWKRTSSILNTYGVKGGTLSVNKAFSISGSVSGGIKGIVTIGTGSNISSSTGKTWSVGKNKRAYVQCRAEYTIEKGIRNKVSTTTGKILSKNSYTVKRPRGMNYREHRIKYL